MQIADKITVELTYAEMATIRLALRDSQRLFTQALMPAEAAEIQVLRDKLENLRK